MGKDALGLGLDRSVGFQAKVRVRVRARTKVRVDNQPSQARSMVFLMASAWSTPQKTSHVHDAHPNALCGREIWPFVPAGALVLLELEGPRCDAALWRSSFDLGWAVTVTHG